MKDDVFNDCLQHWLRSDGTVPFWSDLAQKWGYQSGEVLRGAFKRERTKRHVTKSNSDTSFKESVESRNDGTTVSDRLIEICEMDC